MISRNIGFWWDSDESRFTSKNTSCDLWQLNGGQAPNPPLSSPNLSLTPAIKRHDEGGRHRWLPQPISDRRSNRENGIKTVALWINELCEWKSWTCVEFLWQTLSALQQSEDLSALASGGHWRETATCLFGDAMPSNLQCSGFKSRLVQIGRKASTHNLNPGNIFMGFWAFQKKKFACLLMTAEAKPENVSLFMRMPIGHFNITVCSFLSLTTSPGNSIDPGLNQLSGPEKRGKKHT